MRCPAHANGGKYRDGIAIHPAGIDEVRDKAQRCPHGTQCSDGEGNKVRVGKAEQPFKHDAALGPNPGQKLHAFVGSAGEITTGRRTEGEQHHQGGNYQHTGNDGNTHIHTSAATIEEGVQNTLEKRLGVFLHLGFGQLCWFTGILRGKLRHFLQNETLHEAGGNDAAAAGTEKPDKRLGIKALPHHEHNHQQAHTESCAEIGEGDELVLLEIGADPLKVGLFICLLFMSFIS